MALPAPKTKQRTPSRGSGAGKVLPFLKAEDLTDKPKHVSIIAVDANGSTFSDVVLTIKMEGSQWLLGLNTTSPVYHRLVEALGVDETEWPGREFSLFAEWNDRHGRNFTAVKEVLPAKKRK
jgi:hypothetical protein